MPRSSGRSSRIVLKGPGRLHTCGRSAWRPGGRRPPTCAQPGQRERAGKDRGRRTDPIARRSHDPRRSQAVGSTYPLGAVEGPQHGARACSRGPSLMHPQGRPKSDTEKGTPMGPSLPPVVRDHSETPPVTAQHKGPRVEATRRCAYGPRTHAKNALEGPTEPRSTVVEFESTRPGPAKHPGKRWPYSRGDVFCSRVT